MLQKDDISMYTGNNPTALRSQSALAGALTELMTEKPFCDINIKEICLRADISRQTFYQLFISKEEVIQYIINEILYRMKNEFLQKHDYTFKGIFYSYFNFFSKNSEFIKLLADNRLFYMLPESTDAVTESMAEMIETNQPEYTRKYSNAFLSASMSSVLLRWFRDEDKIKIEELADIIADILHGKYFIENPVGIKANDIYDEITNR